MAAVATPVSCTLAVKYQAGVSASGAAQYKTANYSSVKTDATAQGIYDVGVAISGLCGYTLAEIHRVDTSNLANH